MFMTIPEKEAILASIVPLLFFTIVAVILRFYSRSQRRQPYLTDDWLTVPALIIVCGLAFCMFYGVAKRSMGYPSPADDDVISKRSSIEAVDPIIMRARRLEFSFVVMFAPANGLVKLSVLFLYRRIFVIQKNNWKDPRNMFFVGMITLTTMWAIAYSVTFLFMCKGHFEAYFYLIESMEKCVDSMHFAYTYSISDFVLDVLIILIPIPFVWQLRLPTAKKVAVLGVFLLGIMSTAASLIRMLWMIWATNVGYDPTMDEELMLTSELYWCLVEITVGLTAACLPTLRGLVKTNTVDSVFKNVRSIFSSLKSSSSTSKLVATDDASSKGSSKGSAKEKISGFNFSVESYPHLGTTPGQERRIAPWV